MSILSATLPHGFRLLTQSMIQASDLPLSKVLDSSIVADAFEDDSVDFIGNRRGVQSHAKTNPKVLKRMAPPRKFFHAAISLLSKNPVIRRGRRHAYLTLIS